MQNQTSPHRQIRTLNANPRTTKFRNKWNQEETQQIITDLEPINKNTTTPPNKQSNLKINSTSTKTKEKEEYTYLNKKTGRKITGTNLTQQINQEKTISTHQHQTDLKLLKQNTLIQNKPTTNANKKEKQNTPEITQENLNNKTTNNRYENPVEMINPTSEHNKHIQFRERKNVKSKMNEKFIQQTEKTKQTETQRNQKMTTSANSMN
jgi:hypothetical protein